MQEAPIALVVGLGNPGPTYAETRHNIGFMLIDALRSRLGNRDKPTHTADSYVWSPRIGARQVHLQTPLTYMNSSGLAVSALARRLSIPAAQILVVYDDLDLPLGRVRLRKRGSSGGHNGITSIIEQLGRNDFCRLRVGIGAGPGRENTIDYVLTPFAASEQPLLTATLELATDALQMILRRGMTPAMNQFNASNLADDQQPPSESAEESPT